MSDGKVNIRPGVSVLSVLKHLNYTYWHALAEFVDNALQSYLVNRDRLEAIDQNCSALLVKITVDPRDGGSIIVFDNAAGIPRSEFPRAFKPAAAPTDRSGLSEFGMGMKSAACWCAGQWSVRTKPLGEPSEYTVHFDVEAIISGNKEEIDILDSPADMSSHYTEIRLEGLHKIPAGRTIGKIKQHLADIYREFIRRGELRLQFDNEFLRYDEPRVLVAPYFKSENEAPQEWKTNIEFDFGGNLRVHGFVAIRETASTSRAGFSLFRRNRVIQGTGDSGYRPERIFGKSNSFAYQRVWGELHLEGFEVSYTKDGFKWDDNEEVFLDLLREELTKDSMPLLQQVKGYRVNEASPSLQEDVEEVSGNVAGALQKHGAPVVAELRSDQGAAPVPLVLSETPTLARREISFSFAPWNWIVSVEVAITSGSEWLEISERASSPDKLKTRRLGIRLSLVHPFMQRFAGSDPAIIEPLLRLAVALGIAETVARESGAEVGRVRQNINELLRRVLATP